MQATTTREEVCLAAMASIMTAASARASPADVPPAASYMPLSVSITTVDAPADTAETACPSAARAAAPPPALMCSGPPAGGPAAAAIPARRKPPYIMSRSM